MNDKVSPYREAIFYRHRQSYTLEMIQQWLIESHSLSVCKSAIARSINKTMNSTSFFERVAPDREYVYFKKKVTARRQAKNYRTHLSRHIGMIKNLHDRGFSALQVFECLTRDGISTSLSSVHRALRTIDEKNRTP